MLDELEKAARTGGGLTVIGLGAIMLLRIFWRKMTEETLTSERLKGETDIIGHLRREVARLAHINDALSVRLTEFQQEVNNLRTENADLRAEVATLTAEVKRFGRGEPGCRGYEPKRCAP